MNRERRICLDEENLNGSRSVELKTKNLSEKIGHLSRLTNEKTRPRLRSGYTQIFPGSKSQREMRPTSGLKIEANWENAGGAKEKSLRSGARTNNTQ
jgi:hypothetical protein